MANQDHPTYTEQVGRSTNLSSNPSLRPLQSKPAVYRAEFTIPSDLTAGDKIRLPFPRIPNFFIKPETSRLSSKDGAGIAVVFTLKKVDTAGTETALTAAATVDASSAKSVALARPSTVDVPAVAETDYLMLLVGTVTTATADKVLVIELDGYSEQL